MEFQTSREGPSHCDRYVSELFVESASNHGCSVCRSTLFRLGYCYVHTTIIICGILHTWSSKQSPKKIGYASLTHKRDKAKVYAGSPFSKGGMVPTTQWGPFLRRLRKNISHSCNSYLCHAWEKYHFSNRTGAWPEGLLTGPHTRWNFQVRAACW